MYYEYAEKNVCNRLMWLRLVRREELGWEEWAKGFQCHLQQTEHIHELTGCLKFSNNKMAFPEFSKQGEFCRFAGGELQKMGVVVEALWTETR